MIILTLDLDANEKTLDVHELRDSETIQTLKLISSFYFYHNKQCIFVFVFLFLLFCHLKFEPLKRRRQQITKRSDPFLRVFADGNKRSFCLDRHRLSDVSMSSRTQGPNRSVAWHFQFYVNLRSGLFSNIRNRRIDKPTPIVRFDPDCMFKNHDWTSE